MMDNRQPWEIVVSLNLQKAASYLALLEKTPTGQAAYERAFHIDNGGLAEWARDKAQVAVNEANEKAAGRDCAAPSVALPYAEQLRALGLAGNVRSAGGIRIDVEAL